jgi:hypothetical protein
MFQLRTLEDTSLRRAQSRRKYAEWRLETCKKSWQNIKIACNQAFHYFPGEKQFQPKPLIKTAELGIIVNYISGQLRVLNYYFSIVYNAGLPVDKDLNLFHHLADRMILIASLVTEDHSRLFDHRSSYRPPSEISSPELLAKEDPMWKDEHETDLSLLSYSTASKGGVNALMQLHSLMSVYLHHKTESMAADRTEIGSWLSTELLRFANRTHPAADKDNEIAVYTFAYALLRLKNLMTENRVKSLLLNLRTTNLQIRHLRNLLDPTVQTSQPNQVVRARKAITGYQIDMYRQIGDFCRQFYRCRERKPEDIAKDQEQVDKFSAIVDTLVCQEESKERIRDPFTRLVKLARIKLPFARGTQILEVAKRVYYSGDMTLFDKASLPAPVPAPTPALEITLQGRKADLRETIKIK